MRFFQPKSKTVLVVDDDASTLGLIRYAGEKAGFSITGAVTAAEGFSAMQKQGNKFSAILIDVMLPGATGWTLRKQILDQWPQANIIIMSGAQESFAYMPRGDVIACMVKPTTFTQFFAHLRGKA